METPKSQTRRRTTKARMCNKDVCDMLNSRGGNLIKAVENTLIRDEEIMDEGEAPSTSKGNPNSTSDPSEIPLDVLEVGKELLNIAEREGESDMECEEVLCVSEVNGKVSYNVPPEKNWTSEQVKAFADQFVEIIDRMKESQIKDPQTSTKESPESKKPKMVVPTSPLHAMVLNKLSEGVTLKPLKIGLKSIRVTLENLGVSYQEAEDMMKHLDDVNVISLIKHIKLSKGQNGRFLGNYRE